SSDVCSSDLRPNRTPLSSRTPIAIKLVVRILRGVLIRMLLPLRIVEPDPGGGLKLFFLESVEEFRNHTLLRKITIAPGQPGYHKQRDNRSSDHDPATPRAGFVEWLGIQKGHGAS